MLTIAELRPVQALLASLLLKHRHLMVMLPRQEGKTELGIRVMRDILLQPTTMQGLFLAKSHESVKRMTREKFMRIYEDGKFNVNSAQIVAKHLETNACFLESVDKQPNKLRGGTYDIVHWAEVAFSEFDHGVTANDVFLQVIDPTLRENDGRTYLESTPNGPGGWKDMWYDEKSYPDHMRICFPLSRLVEFGLASREYYEKQKSKLPDVMFRQEYECEFVSYMGMAFEEFKTHHIWKDMPAPNSWDQVLMGIDWGWDPSATCVLFAYKLDDRILIFDEIYENRILLADLEKEIKLKLNEHNLTKIASVADHEMKSNEELRRAGIPCVEANKSNVLGVRMQIKTLMKGDKIYVHPRCKNLIRDWTSATWDDKKHGEINYRTCTWGHYDGEAAARYLIRELSGMVLDS